MSSSLKKGDAQALPDYADQDYMILDLSPPPQLALSVRGLCKTYKIAQSIDDHVTAAEALAAAGVEVQHTRARGQIHTSIPAVGVMLSGAGTRAEMARALRHFSAAGVPA